MKTYIITYKVSAASKELRTMSRYARSLEHARQVALVILSDPLIAGAVLVSVDEAPKESSLTVLK